MDWFFVPVVSTPCLSSAEIYCVLRFTACSSMLPSHRVALTYNMNMLQGLTRMLLLYPAMTVKVVAMIYWQALKLKLKRTPFYDHPGETMHVN